MPRPLTAEDLLPLVGCLSQEERLRLLRLITTDGERDAEIYALVPPQVDEFSSEEDALAWDADGWEGVG